MRKQLASHLELALVMPDAIDAWNRVVTARRLTIIVDYTTHTPLLLAKVTDSEECVWMAIDTRAKTLKKWMAFSSPDVQLAVDHMIEALAKAGMRLTFLYKRDKQKRRTVSMRLVSTTGGPMTAVLHTVSKGSRVEYQEFKLTDKWN